MIGNESERTRLVRAAVDGDRVALKVLLTESRATLHERLRWKIPADIRSRIDPDDVVQEAHVEAFRSIAECRASDEPSFNRWLGVIALNRLRDAVKYHRAEKRGRPVSASRKNATDSSVVLFEMLVGPTKSPSRCIARAEAVAAVDAALERIPERYRQAVQLVYLNGASIRDAAAGMGRTERAVHGLCRRGLRFLRHELGSSTHYLSSTG